MVRKLDTENLIEFLRGEEDLQLNETHFEILRNEEIAGRDFLKVTEEKLRSYGMKGGPASRIADFAKEVKEKKMRAFSSFLSLKEVLEKFDLNSDGIEAIPLFELPVSEIQEEDRHLMHCMAEILVQLKSYGTLQPDSLEAMRNEYVIAL